MIDHPAQLQYLVRRGSKPASPVSVFVKINTGYPRAGVTPDSHELSRLLAAIAQHGRESIKLIGFYSHLGTSYGGSTPEEALDGLQREIELAVRAADRTAGTTLAAERLIISVGATPTASSAQNLLSESGHGVGDVLRQVQARYEIELHAGVYPLLDLQQLATHARPERGAGPAARMSSDDIGIEVLVEVLSVYGERERPEALVGGGSLVFSKEACKSYEGYGIVKASVSDSGKVVKHENVYDESRRRGWIVGRIAQEHGVLVWEGQSEGRRELGVGERVLVWPNHACITSACFAWYVIVDSERGDGRVVDVWVRGRGW